MANLALHYTLHPLEGARRQDGIYVDEQQENK